MGESIYQAFLISILRTLLVMAGTWLVQRGLVETSLMQEVAAGLALLIVTQMWAFYRVHRRALYQRWLVLLGIEAPTGHTDPADIEAQAQRFVRLGLKP